MKIWVFGWVDLCVLASLKICVMAYHPNPMSKKFL
jgi:hypothetical protein